MPPGSQVATISGLSAEKTSELVAARVAVERGSPPERVLVAPLARPDLALGLATPAYARAWPVVFAAGSDGGLPARVATHTGAASALVIDSTGTGDPAARAAADALRSALGTASVERKTYSDCYYATWGIAEWAAGAGLDFARPVFGRGRVAAP